MSDPVLEIRHVSKSFQLPAASNEASPGQKDSLKLDVLTDVSFKVGDKENVAIMGPSGGGKSTLLSLLAGLDTPDAGQVIVKGRDLTSMSQNELNEFRAKKIGIVFQQFQLIDHFTALENVRLPLDLAAPNAKIDAKRADEIAKEKLVRVGLGGRLNQFPDKLSRGECQRVAIARVLATGAPLILADEPTGSLDGKTGEDVMKLLFSSARDAGASVVLVTHDPVLAKTCDRLYRIENGRLHESVL